MSSTSVTSAERRSNSAPRRRNSSPSRAPDSVMSMVTREGAGFCGLARVSPEESLGSCSASRTAPRTCSVADRAMSVAERPARTSSMILVPVVVATSADHFTPRHQVFAASIATPWTTRSGRSSRLLCAGTGVLSVIGHHLVRSAPGMCQPAGGKMSRCARPPAAPRTAPCTNSNHSSCLTAERSNSLKSSSESLCIWVETKAPILP